MDDTQQFKVSDDALASVVDAPVEAETLQTHSPDAETPDSAEAESENKAVAKTKGKGKKAATGDVLPADIISQASFKIENMSSDEALEFANSLNDGSSFNFFQLGGVFSIVIDKKYFSAYGFPSFKDWVLATHNMKYRKAMYFVEIYNAVIELGLTWDQIKDLGWTKTMVLIGGENSPVTKENFDVWAAKALKLTVNQLADALEGQKKIASEGTAATEQDDTSKVTTMTFKLHTDQKELVRGAIEKAKEMAGTKHDTVALEMIAADFMGKAMPVAPQADQLPDLFKTLGYEKVLESFEAAFPEMSFSISDVAGA